MSVIGGSSEGEAVTSWSKVYDGTQEWYISNGNGSFSICEKH